MQDCMAGGQVVGLGAQRRLFCCMQVDGFVKAAQKGGKGLTGLLRKMSIGRDAPQAAGAAGGIGIDDLLQYSNVGDHWLRYGPNQGCIGAARPRSSCVQTSPARLLGH
jgi:hypothetical protein